MTFSLFLVQTLQIPSFASAKDDISLDKVNDIVLSPEAAALHDAVNYPADGNKGFRTYRYRSIRSSMASCRYPSSCGIRRRIRRWTGAWRQRPADEKPTNRGLYGAVQHYRPSRQCSVGRKLSNTVLLLGKATISKQLLIINPFFLLNIQR